MYVRATALPAHLPSLMLLQKTAVKYCQLYCYVILSYMPCDSMTGGENEDRFDTSPSHVNVENEGAISESYTSAPQVVFPV